MKLIALVVVCLILLSSVSAITHKKQKTLESKEPEDQQKSRHKKNNPFVQKIEENLAKKREAEKDDTSSNKEEISENTSKEAGDNPEQREPLTRHNNLATNAESTTSQTWAFQIHYDYHSVDDLYLDEELAEHYGNQLFDFYSSDNGLLYTYYLMDIISYNAGWAQISPPVLGNLEAELQWWDEDGNYTLTRDEFIAKFKTWCEQVATNTHPGQDYDDFDYQGYTLQQVYGNNDLTQQLGQSGFEEFSEGADQLEFWPTFDLLQYNCGWARIGHTSYAETNYYIQSYSGGSSLKDWQYQYLFEDFLQMAIGACPS